LKAPTFQAKKKWLDINKNNIQKYAKDQSQNFREALVSDGGPLPEYRWEAWQTIIIPRTQKVGEYIEWVEKGLADTYWSKEVGKDINRTFAKHPYFSNGMVG
jgi:hypothetical protein